MNSSDFWADKFYYKFAEASANRKYHRPTVSISDQSSTSASSTKPNTSNLDRQTSSNALLHHLHNKYLQSKPASSLSKVNKFNTLDNKQLSKAIDKSGVNRRSGESSLRLRAPPKLASDEVDDNILSRVQQWPSRLFGPSLNRSTNKPIFE